MDSLRLHSERVGSITSREGESSAPRQLEVELQAAIEALQVAEEDLRQEQDAFLEAQVRTEEQRHRYQDLFDGAPDAYLVTDRDMVIREANVAASTLFGIPRTELTTKPLPGLFSPSDRRALRALRSRLTTDGPKGEWIASVTPGGQPVEVAITGAAIHHAVTGEATGYRWLIRDVSERRRQEEDARRLTDELERSVAERSITLEARADEIEAAGRAKAQFLSAMSHELRTPINAVMGYADLLALGVSGSLTDEQAMYVERVRLTSRSLIRIVDEILDLARVEVGRLSVAADRCVAASAVYEAIQVVTPTAQERGITLSTTSGEHDEPVFLGDHTRVVQILVHLLSNAVRFSDPGKHIELRWVHGDTLRDGAEPHAAGPWTIIEVEDFGIGIPSDKLDAVFEPFRQLDAGYTRRLGGTGLGLTISRRLARVMEGDITVRSTPGAGSTFTLWLPAPRTASSSRREGGPDHTPWSDLTLAAMELRKRTRHILDAVTTKLRVDPLIPRAREADEASLQAHLASLLASVVESLAARGSSRSDYSWMLSDGEEIQRVLASRHGLLRRRQQWTPEALHREYAILREELLGGATARRASDTGVSARLASNVIGNLLERAERESLRGYNLPGAASQPPS